MTPVRETRDRVSLQACGGQPSAKSFAAAEHDRDREDGHRVREVVGQECMDEFSAAG
jgi:hypothetical protein